jgi:hypothetical protein
VATAVGVSQVIHRPTDYSSGARMWLRRCRRASREAISRRLSSSRPTATSPDARSPAPVRGRSNVGRLRRPVGVAVVAERRSCSRVPTQLRPPNRSFRSNVEATSPTNRCLASSSRLHWSMWTASTIRMSHRTAAVPTTAPRGSGMLRPRARSATADDELVTADRRRRRMGRSRTPRCRRSRTIHRVLGRCDIRTRAPRCSVTAPVDGHPVGTVVRGGVGRSSREGG